MQSKLEKLQEWVEDFLCYQTAQRGATPRTVGTYREALGQACEFLVRTVPAERECMWDVLDTDDLRMWVAEQMQCGYAPAYVKRNVAALRSFYRFLLREKRVAVDPVRMLRTPKLPKRLPTFIREEEMDRLFAHYPFGEDYAGIRDRTMLLVLYHTGLRSAELLGMNLADVSLSEKNLRVVGKGNKPRIIPFGQELADSLYIYIKEWRDFLGVGDDVVAADLPLFVNGKRHRLAYNELRGVVREALSAVTTQKKRSPHVLRHSFATAMLAGGAQLEAIQQLMGHASVATTAIYTHTTLAELKDAYRTAHPRSGGEKLPKGRE